MKKERLRKVRRCFVNEISVVTDDYQEATQARYLSA